MKQLSEVKRMQQLSGILKESFDKGMEDIAMTYSNTKPNTPPGATAGIAPEAQSDEAPLSKKDFETLSEGNKEKLIFNELLVLRRVLMQLKKMIQKGNDVEPEKVIDMVLKTLDEIDRLKQ